ncbi:hypothetical protein MGN70_013113 [Eutypa lata]|nr:hypothetical protein MGN70_013113 [Eutypa lata]
MFQKCELGLPPINPFAHSGRLFPAPPLPSPVFNPGQQPPISNPQITDSVLAGLDMDGDVIMGGTELAPSPPVKKAPNPFDRPLEPTARITKATNRNNNRNGNNKTKKKNKNKNNHKHNGTPARQNQQQKCPPRSDNYNGRSSASTRRPRYRN